MTTDATLLWFRQDLRLADQRALQAALQGGGPVIPLYILDDDTPGDWRPGGASRWWLHHSLASLAGDLDELGSRLILRRGGTGAVLRQAIEKTGAARLHITRRYEPWADGLDQRLAEELEGEGIAFRRFAGSLLFEPEAARTKAGDPFKVFTPFYKTCLNLDAPKPPLARPEGKLPAPEHWPSSDRLEDWSLRPEKPDWAGGLRETWQPGEAGAEEALQLFLDETMAGYAEARDRPDRSGTSRLSPHLHFGEISPHRCWQAVEDRMAANSGGGARGARSFQRELGWREFSYHLLAHWPDLPKKAFRPEFEDFPWHEDQAALEAWQRGQTGYPIVDAGMRELWQTGWMHNRVRMVTASFLIKHLLLHWRQGEAWFWDTLVDADLANNSASWQWVAGSGADAAPYFRVFNPILQGKKFDPKGEYVRRFVPELADLPTEHLHTPWEAPKEALAAAGVELGETYPMPIVDHGKARKRALQAYETIKKG